MEITGILWLEDIVEKLIRKHKVDKREVIDVLQSRPFFRFVEKGYRKGENVYSAFGQTVKPVDIWWYTLSIKKKSSSYLICKRYDYIRKETI